MLFRTCIATCAWFMPLAAAELPDLTDLTRDLGMVNCTKYADTDTTKAAYTARAIRTLRTFGDKIYIGQGTDGAGPMRMRAIDTATGTSTEVYKASTEAIWRFSVIGGDLFSPCIDNNGGWGNSDAPANLVMRYYRMRADTRTWSEVNFAPRPGSLYNYNVYHTWGVEEVLGRIYILAQAIPVFSAPSEDLLAYTGPTAPASMGRDTIASDSAPIAAVLPRWRHAFAYNGKVHASGPMHATRPSIFVRASTTATDASWSIPQDAANYFPDVDDVRPVHRRYVAHGFPRPGAHVYAGSVNTQAITGETTPTPPLALGIFTAIDGVGIRRVPTPNDQEALAACPVEANGAAVVSSVLDTATQTYRNELYISDDLRTWRNAGVIRLPSRVLAMAYHQGTYYLGTGPTTGDTVGLASSGHIYALTLAVPDVAAGIIGGNAQYDLTKPMTYTMAQSTRQVASVRVLWINNHGAIGSRLRISDIRSVGGAGKLPVTIDLGGKALPIILDRTSATQPQVRIQVSVTPTALGAWEAPLEIVSNDPNESVARVVLSGTAEATPRPEIQAKLGSRILATTEAPVTIASAIANQARTINLWIMNEGTSPLELYDLYAVSGSRNNCSAARLTAMPRTTSNGKALQPGGAMYASCTITPGASGAWSVRLALTSNDSDEGTLRVALSGTASTTPAISTRMVDDLGLDDGIEPTLDLDTPVVYPEETSTSPSVPGNSSSSAGSGGGCGAGGLAALLLGTLGMLGLRRRR